jgi:uncharacterized membrane protein
MADTPRPAGSRPPVTGRTRDFVISADRAILGFARHWLLYLNLFVFVYVGLPFLAPVLLEANLPGPARVIYALYSSLCHQLGYRSWYLFGEQIAYPRDIFQQYSGIDPYDPNQLLAARQFTGNETMGYKVAYCERDTAIYGAILLGGLIFALPGVAAKVKPLNFLAYAVLGVGPIALDGFSQLFSQYPYNTLSIFAWLPYRESTPWLRALTGLIFGFANVWLAYPYLAQSMTDVKHELEHKFRKAGIAH